MSIIDDFADINRRMNRKPAPVALGGLPSAAPPHVPNVTMGGCKYDPEQAKRQYANAINQHSALNLRSDPQVLKALYEAADRAASERCQRQRLKILDEYAYLPNSGGD